MKFAYGVDPEAAAGRALRSLRLSRGWSQEEVARRLKFYGYDFHQTMVAKIENGQRPLRVRELADFAALYGVRIEQLVYPSPDSPEDIEREITNLEHMLGKAEEDAEEARRNRDLEARVLAAQQSLIDVTTARLDFLREVQAILTQNES